MEMSEPTPQPHDDSLMAINFSGILNKSINRIQTMMDTTTPQYATTPEQVNL